MSHIVLHEFEYLHALMCSSSSSEADKIVQYRKGDKKPAKGKGKKKK